MINLRLLLVFSMAALLSGCIGGATKPSSFYSLSASESSQQENVNRTGGPGIRIGLFAFPDYLSRPNIVTRSTDNSFVIDEFQRWAGSLENDFHRTLGANLGTLLDSGNISVYPADSLLSARYQVIGEVISFDGYLGQKAILDVRWLVVDEADNKAHGSMHSVIVEPVAGEDYAAFIAAQSRAVGRLSRAIADEINHLLANNQK
mgnify:CR=1 FL=1